VIPNYNRYYLMRKLSKIVVVFRKVLQQKGGKSELTTMKHALKSALSDVISVSVKSKRSNK
jgi:hypothetical protein